MSMTVYRYSRITVFYAAFLLAATWNGIISAKAHGFEMHSAFVMLPWLTGPLLLWDCLQSLRKRPLYFKEKSSVQLLVALLLLLGTIGTFALMNSAALAAHWPLKAIASKAQVYLSGQHLWKLYGQGLMVAGMIGVVLMLILGKRPPSRSKQ